VEAVVDGSDDKGLDAILVPEDGEALAVVQTKLYENHDKSFPASDIEKTLNGVDWLLNGNLEDVTNVAFVAKAQAFRQQFLETFPVVNVLMAGTCTPPEDNGVAEITKFNEKYNRYQQTFTVEVLDLGRLVQLFERSLRATTPNIIDLELAETPYERSVSGTRTVVGSVSADQIATLVDAHGDALFEINVRNYLGNVKINQGILTTASDPVEAGSFLFYNNGLTLVCEDISYRGARDAKKIRLTNAQIVNGCQTATGLRKAQVAGTLRADTEVLVKVIERADPDFVDRVTQFTNSQNAVKSADLVGGDPLQRALAEELARMGYFYERRRGDFRSQYPTVEAKVAALGASWQSKKIDLPVAAQACASFYSQIPVIAKKNVTYLFLEASERGRYTEVFGRMTGEKLVLASRLFDAVRGRRRRLVDYAAQLGRRLEWLPQADHFLLGLLYRLHFDGERIDDLGYLDSFNAEVDASLETWYLDLLTRVDNYVEAKRERDPAYNAPTFFKSETGYTELVMELAQDRGE
jgi:hypothetical protein